MEDDSRIIANKTGKGHPPVEHQFKAGNPGRPKGSRNKLGEAFIEALHDDFIDHGPAVIARVRQEDPVAYVKVCASILPKELNLRHGDDLSDSDIDERIRQLASILSIEVGTPEPARGKEEKAVTSKAGPIPTIQ